MNRSAPWIGIALGDITGVGPEVTLKALAAAAPGAGGRHVLIGDAARLRDLNQQLHTGLDLRPYSGPDSAGALCILQPDAPPLPADLSPGAAPAARAALAWLDEGARRCLRGEFAALVTAPVNKEAILRTGVRFVGQTEHLAGLAGTARFAMMLLGEDDRGRPLRVVLATTHLALAQVAEALTRAKVEVAIALAAAACRQLGLARARVGVCGLNPHAGEGGLLGTEELSVIAPAIAAQRAQGVDAHGPLSADTLFHQAWRGDYDVVVAMYHDQGLAPLKLIAFDTGVNWTLGLPFIRTSPDHGTAYDLAGRGAANPSSMAAALALARRLATSAPA
jgi:4-hydroxythreonine-4-phosphate dehydrogenase